MLLEYKIKNFKSIGSELTLSMDFVNAKKPSNSKRLNFFDLKDKDFKRVNYIMGVYGPNASGKSNIIDSFKDLEYIVKYQSKDNKKPIFTPHKAYENEETSFELTFYSKERNALFEYFISYNDKGVTKEKLKYKKVSSKVSEYKIIFAMSNEEMELDKGSLSEDNRLDLSKFVPRFDDVINFYNLKKGNRSFLYHFLEEYKSTEFYNDVLKYIFDINIIDVDKDIFNDNLDWVDDLKSNKDRYIDATKIFLNDNSIKDIEVEVASLSYEDLPSFLRSGLSKEDFINMSEKSENKPSKTKIELIKDHKKTGKVLKLNIKDESEGTKKFYQILPTLFSSFINGGVVVIDELETNLHPYLARKIIEMFRDENINTGNAQLIFTTHDAYFLEHNILNRQEVAFVEKDDLESYLYYLTDIKDVRKTGTFRKQYLEGRYGAVPNFKRYMR